MEIGSKGGRGRWEKKKTHLAGEKGPKRSDNSSSRGAGGNAEPEKARESQGVKGKNPTGFPRLDGGERRHRGVKAGGRGGSGDDAQAGGALITKTERPHMCGFLLRRAPFGL